ncbi:MAG: hypothetical protein JNJ78_07145 [Anaerolineae bacterium]|nr:hypothetical protein [Anaerolineae bacterium]
MYRIIAIGVILFGLLGAGFANVEAQNPSPPLAAIQAGSIVISGGINAPVTIPLPPNYGVMSLSWNPGGTRLALILNSEQFETQLYVVDSTGGSLVPLASGPLEAGFPANWTPDGQVLYVGRGLFPTDGNTPYRADIKRIAADANAVPETIGSFDMLVGCGGGSNLPADWQYWEEAGFGGTRLVLQYTDYGILHSTSCSGDMVALFAPQGGIDSPIGPTLRDDGQLNPDGMVSRHQLGPDGMTLAGLRQKINGSELERTLVLIDLASGTMTDVPTQAQPDQFVWAADGSLFYSSRSETGNLLTALDTAQLSTVNSVLGMEGFEIPAYEVSIHRVNPGTGEDSLVYSGSAYAIGRMAVTRDGSALVFSQIANMDAWIAGIADGSLNILNDDTIGSAQQALVPVSVYQQSLAGGSAALIGEGLNQFSLKP